MQPSRNSSRLVGAIVLAAIAGIWMVLAPVLGHMGPPWPCVAAGVLILVCGAAAVRWAAQRRLIGVITMIVAGGVMLMGSGGILPGAVGVVAGLLLVLDAPNSPAESIE